MPGGSQAIALDGPPRYKGRLAFNHTKEDHALKKETAIISVIAVAVVAFMLGRLSVDTATPSKSPTETVKQAAEKAPAVGQAAPAAVAPTTEAAPEQKATAGIASLPSKGAENPKVAIVEVSEFQ